MFIFLNFYFIFYYNYGIFYFTINVYFFRDVKAQNKYTEYLAIGDSAGQLTLMEVSKLFSEPVCLYKNYFLFFKNIFIYILLILF
jgi:hypothetical protein